MEALSDGRIAVALRESPFYAESGGQTADLGLIESDEGRAAVEDVQQHGEVQVIVARVLDGRVEAGTRVKASLSSSHRHDVAANHTATHLLHWALRTRLGKDVTQAGSSVRADKFRFDFAYHEPLGPKRLAEVEEAVNRRIVENNAVRTFTTTLEHARDLGAMALFGEKYDDFVRVVEIDDFSRELCGGTHVGSTSELGAFKILSEGSVGANIRRIEAVTGREAVAYYRMRDVLAGKAAQALGAANDDLLRAIERTVLRIHALEEQVRASRAETAKDLAESLAGRATVINGVSVVAEVAEAHDMEHLLSLVDQVRDRTAPAVVVLGSVLGGKGVLVVSVTPGVTGVDAGAIVKACAQEFGGGGGGNAQLGRGGGSDPARMPEAVQAARQAVLRWPGGGVRVLGVDFGGSRTGLALSDPLGLICRPLVSLG